MKKKEIEQMTLNCTSAYSLQNMFFMFMFLFSILFLSHVFIGIVCPKFSLVKAGPRKAKCSIP
jgi:hypothetical protein